jgi:hypothetical protein
VRDCLRSAKRVREKEDAIEQVRREVEALRSVTPLLPDAEALRTVAPLLVDETEDLDLEVRARLVEATENDSKLGRARKISRQLRHFATPFAASQSRVMSSW